MSFTKVARMCMEEDYLPFAARNRELAAALADAYVAAGGKNLDVPAALLRVQDAANGALVLLFEPTVEQIERWNALPDLRLRARAVLDALDGVPANFTTACLQHAIATSITAVDALLGSDWAAACPSAS